jgi:hypothetical protein
VGGGERAEDGSDESRGKMRGAVDLSKVAISC